MIHRGLIAAAMCVATSVAAFEVGTSDYVFSSDLSAQGYVPFGTGGVAGDVFGMGNGSNIYLCFLMDTPDNQSTRQTALIDELRGAAESRAVPNIPIVCVLTQ